MALDFSINGVNNILNNASKGMKLKNIPFEDIVRNENNEFEISDIESLAISISDVGLRQPLEVKPIGNNKYMLIGGERRYTAIKMLLEQGNERYEEIPCIVTEPSNIALPISDELKELYALNTTNAEQREFSDHDIMVMVANQKKIYQALKEAGHPLKGKQRDLIAEDLQMSSRQVQRYDYIGKNLSSEFKEELKEEKIPLTVAVEVAKLTPKEQKELHKSVKDKTEVTQKDVEQFVEKKEQKKNKSAIDSSLIYDSYLKDKKEFSKISELIISINDILSEPKTFSKSEYKKMLTHIEKVQCELEKCVLLLQKK